MEIQLNQNFLSGVSFKSILFYEMSIEENSEYKRVIIFLQMGRRRSTMGHLARRSTGTTLLRHPQVLEDRTPPPSSPYMYYISMGIYIYFFFSKCLFQVVFRNEGINQFRNISDNSYIHVRSAGELYLRVGGGWEWG